MSETPGQASLVLAAETPRVEVERILSGLVRVRRVLVAERRTIEVEVVHEELVVERVAVDALPDGATMPPPGGVEPLTIDLRTERIEIVKRIVPTERVTVRVDRVTDTEVVPVEVSREIAELHDPSGTATAALRS